MSVRRDRDRPAQTSSQSAESFNHALLNVARCARGLTQSEFAERVGVKQNAVSRWEDGLRIPCMEDVERIAEVLGRTVDFFFQPDRPCGVDTAFLFHRKRKRTPIGVAKQIEARINILIVAIRRLLRSVEQWDVRFEHMDVDDERFEGPRQIAHLARAMWQIPFGPIPNLVAMVESAGAITCPMDFNTSDVDAVGVWPWDMPPMFFLNDSAPAERARFSLAHEIAHVVMHRVPTPEMEEQADEFASELLMPSREVKADLSGLSYARAFQLKPRWKVSAQAIIRKARDIGAITPAKYKSLCVMISKNGHRKQEPNPIAPEQATTIQRLIAAHTGGLGYEEADVGRIAFYSDLHEFRMELLGDRGDPRPLRVFR